MSAPTLSWLWPDHVIGKRESRRLRDEHNALVNHYVEAIQLLLKAESGEHAEDERGKCRCSQCEWRRERTAFLDSIRSEDE